MCSCVLGFFFKLTFGLTNQITVFVGNSSATVSASDCNTAMQHFPLLWPLSRTTGTCVVICGIAADTLHCTYSYRLERSSHDSVCHPPAEDTEFLDALVIKPSILTPPSRRLDEFPCSLTLFVHQTVSFLRLFNLQLSNCSALHLPAIAASGGFSSHVDIGGRSESQ